MKLSRNMCFILFILLIIGNVFSHDEILEKELEIINANITLDFSHFPTENIWNETTSIPLLNTTLKRDNAEIISDAIKLEPNFDGKYRLVEIVDDDRITGYFIIDLNTGLIYEERLYYSGVWEIKCVSNSSLIVITRNYYLVNNEISEKNNYTNASTVYYKWNGQFLVTLLGVNVRYFHW